MKVSDYIKKIEEINNPDKLLKLKKTIEADPELSEGDKRVLISIHLMPKIKKLMRGRDIYIHQAEEALRELEGIVEPDLYEVLEGYLLVEAPSRYTSLETLRKRVLGYIPSFIKYVYNLKKKVIGLYDLDADKLKTFHVERFIDSRTDSEHERYMIASYLNTFGKWIEENYRDFRFPRVKKKRPKKKRLPTFLIEELKESKEKTLAYLSDEEGIPRNLKELDKIFPAWDYVTERLNPLRRDQLRIFLRLLLQTGLRPEHALSLRVKDFYEDNISYMRDVWDRDFVMVSIAHVLEREKKAMGLSESDIIKQVPGVVFISESLYERIMNMIETYELSDNNRICGVPHSSQKELIIRLRKITGIVNFKRKDLRPTWASVIYNASGYNIRLTKEMGGWKTERIPVDVYVAVMSPEEAVKIAKKYEIFLPKSVKASVDKIEKGISPKVEALVEEIRKLKEKLKQLTGVEEE